MKQRIEEPVAQAVCHSQQPSLIATRRNTDALTCDGPATPGVQSLMREQGVLDVCMKIANLLMLSYRTLMADDHLRNDPEKASCCFCCVLRSIIQHVELLNDGMPVSELVNEITYELCAPHRRVDRVLAHVGRRRPSSRGACCWGAWPTG